MSAPARSIAIVTGANRGLGYWTAKKIAEAGYKVIITARDPEKGKAALSRLNSTEPSLNIDFSPLDTSNETSISEFATNYKNKYAKDYDFHILVNNAGIYLDGWDKAVYDQTMDTNFRGVVSLTNHLLPLMISNRSGRIVHLSSGLGRLRNIGSGYRDVLSPENDDQWDLSNLTADAILERVPFRADQNKVEWGRPAYNLSKACLNTWTRLLTRKLAKEHDQTVLENLLINVVDPGWVRTEMGGSAAARSIEEGIETPVWLAINQPKGGPTGLFFTENNQQSEW